MRVLVTYKDERRLLGEAVLTGIRMARPHLEARAVRPEALEEGIKRFDPPLVICGPPIPAGAVSERLAWIELSPDPEEPSKIRVEGRYREKANLTLEELLAVVDEVEDAVEESPRETADPNLDSLNFPRILLTGSSVSNKNPSRQSDEKEARGRRWSIRGASRLPSPYG